MSVYPRLDDNLGLSLKALLLASKGDVQYLNSVDCPYGEDLKHHLRLMFAGMSGGGAGAGVVSDDPDKKVRIFNVSEIEKLDVVLQEIENTVEELKSVEARLTSAGKTIDPNEQIQLIKAKTTLLEKWINQKERIYGLKEIVEYQMTVVSFMTDLLDKDQIAEFRKRLSGLRASSVVPEDKVELSGGDEV